MDKSVVGILWFMDENQYQAFRNISTDSDEFPELYTTWLIYANKFIRQTEIQGKKVIKIIVEPLRFYSWCHQLKLNPDARARKKYVELKMRQQDSAKNG